MAFTVAVAALGAFVGTPWTDARTASQGGHRGERIGEARHPGPIYRPKPAHFQASIATKGDFRNESLVILDYDGVTCQGKVLQYIAAQNEYLCEYLWPSDGRIWSSEFERSEIRGAPEEATWPPLSVPAPGPDKAPPASLPPKAQTKPRHKAVNAPTDAIGEDDVLPTLAPTDMARLAKLDGAQSKEPGNTPPYRMPHVATFSEDEEAGFQHNQGVPQSMSEDESTEGEEAIAEVKRLSGSRTYRFKGSRVWVHESGIDPKVVARFEIRASARRVQQRSLREEDNRQHRVDARRKQQRERTEEDARLASGADIPLGLLRQSEGLRVHLKYSFFRSRHHRKYAPGATARRVRGQLKRRFLQQIGRHRRLADPLAAGKPAAAPPASFPGQDSQQQVDSPPPSPAWDAPAELDGAQQSEDAPHSPQGVQEQPSHSQGSDGHLSQALAYGPVDTGITWPYSPESAGSGEECPGAQGSPAKGESDNNGPRMHRMGYIHNGRLTEVLVAEDSGIEGPSSLSRLIKFHGDPVTYSVPESALCLSVQLATMHGEQHGLTLGAQR